MSTIPLELISQVPVRVKTPTQVKVRKEVSFEEAGTDSQIAKFLQTKDPDLQAEIRSAQVYLAIQNVDVDSYESKTEIKKSVEIDGKQEKAPAIKDPASVLSLEI